jgi:hypothetical protein
MNADLELGLSAEKQLLKTIRSNFGEDLEPTGQYDRFDYENDTTLVELKTRRCLSTTYPDTMIPYSKVKFLREKAIHKKAIFVFNFQDGVYYHEFNRDNNYKVKQGGRRDRGRPEFQQYCFIPKEELLLISKDFN